MKLDECRWQDSLEWQMRLWRWSQTDLAAKFFESFPLAKAQAFIPGWSQKSGKVVADIVTQTMVSCDPWWVSADVAALVAEAAEDMPHDPLVQEDVPAPSGFALIAGPPLLYPALEDGQQTGKKLALRAVSWCTVNRTKEDAQRTALALDGLLQTLEIDQPTHSESFGQPAVIVYHYAHLDDDDDFVAPLRELREGNDPMRLATYIPDLSVTGVTTLPFGDTSMWSPDLVDYSGDTRWTMAFFRFVQQKVIGSDRDYWGRAQRREAKRSGFRPDAEEGYVTSIRLRRVSRPQEEGYEPVPTGRHLTNRHVRSGFWRRQWYPSLQLHRPLYIHATVVGPEGSPLRLRKARGVIVNR